MAQYIVVHSVRVRTEFISETFGRLTTIGPAFLLRNGNQHKAVQACCCVCGNCIVAHSYALKNKHTKSCGCQRIDAAIARSTTHGLCGISEYGIWVGMIGRCSNSKDRRFSDYGGRGISYCVRWKKFENFFADMGPRPSKLHSLDRKDNDGNYEASNCRWATNQEQANNRRNNILVTIGDSTKTLAEWLRELGLPCRAVRGRIARGMTPFDALTTPIKQRNRIS